MRVASLRQTASSAACARMKGAGASHCCAILALYNAGLAALQRRCGLEPGLVMNGNGDGDTEYGTPRTRLMPASENGSMRCVSGPYIPAGV